MNRREIYNLLQTLKALILPFFPPVGTVIVLIGEIIVRWFLRLRMRFLAVGIFTPMVAIAVLMAIVKSGGPIPVTPEVIAGLGALVGFQIVCAVFAVMEAVSLARTWKHLR